MSDEKDQVREQIERDAEVATFDHFEYSGFISGATAQDKIAWNRCLDAVNGLLTEWNAIIGFSPSDLKSMQEELEKLRR